MSRALSKTSIGIGLALTVLAAGLAACSGSAYQQEPALGGPSAGTKQKWMSAPSDDKLDQLRIRLITSQTDR